MKPTVLRARSVFPVDRPPIDNGCVAIEGDRIVAVGPAKSFAGPVHNLGEVALLPALVNAHTHLEFSRREVPLGSPGMDFVEWIRGAIAARARQTGTKQAIDGGLAECTACGVATVGEIVTTDPTDYPHGATSTKLVYFLEVIGFSRARAESALAATLDRLNAWPAGASLGISPHAPYTVSPELLESLVSLATARRLPVAMHLAESQAELELLTSGGGPFRELLKERSMWDDRVLDTVSGPIDYLRILSACPRTLVVHGNYLSGDEIDLLAEHRDRMSLVHCARTHAFFQHDDFPLADLLQRGVHVALGTDSRASNPDLSMWREMQHVVAHHSGVSPDQVLRMGTLAAAEALGVENEVGSITPGKLANLVAMRCPGKTDLPELFHRHEEPQKIWPSDGSDDS